MLMEEANTYELQDQVLVFKADQLNLFFVIIIYSNTFLNTVFFNICHGLRFENILR